MASRTPSSCFKTSRAPYATGWELDDRHTPGIFPSTGLEKQVSAQVGDNQLLSVDRAGSQPLTLRHGLRTKIRFRIHLVRVTDV